MLARWRDEDVFGESLRRRAGAPDWVFYEGPPTANGRPGIHHVWARLFKDLYPRFHTMRGKHVARKGGWDCHGLPVEVEIEKELGFSGKLEIEDYGIERFNAKCRASVQRYVEDWQSLTSRIGMWLDTAGAYWTLHNEYIETVWWLFHEMWERGSIYEGFKVVPYCGRCGTALSSHELGQPGAYRDVTEPSIYVRFPVEAATTTCSCGRRRRGPCRRTSAPRSARRSSTCALRRPRAGATSCSHARESPRCSATTQSSSATCRSASSSARATNRRSRSLPVDGATRVHGRRRRVRHRRGRLRHRAPRAGVRRDRPRGRRARRPPGRQSGQRRRPLRAGRRRAVRRQVREGRRPGADRRARRRAASSCGSSTTRTRIRTAGAATRRSSTGPSPPGSRARPRARTRCCARTRRSTGTRSTSSTAASATGSRTTSTGRCRATATGARRSRSGAAATAAHDTCVGSVAELSDLSGRDLDRHGSAPAVRRRHHHRVPGVHARHRLPDRAGARRVVRLRLDAGRAVPLPVRERRRCSSDRFPADFICEAIDQTRGWFYSLLAVNTLVFDQAPYRNVVCLAHIVDEDGAEDVEVARQRHRPVPVLAERGADALRWYMFSSGSPWTPKRVYVDGHRRGDAPVPAHALEHVLVLRHLREPRRLDTPWRRRAGHARPRPLDPLAAAPHGRAPSPTRSSRFDALAGTQALAELVDDLSNWYVRRSRPRFWKSSDPAAHATLHEALRTLAQLLAPFCPFVADELCRNLAGTDESVHLADWPGYDAAAIDDALEAEMALARTLVSLGRAARADAKLGVRQPLPRAIALARPATSTCATTSSARSPTS